MREVVIRTTSRTIPMRAGADLKNATMLIRHAVDVGVVHTAERVRKSAKNKAPVRKVFRYGRRTGIHTRTVAEAKEEIAAFQKAFSVNKREAYQVLRASGVMGRQTSNTFSRTGQNIFDEEGNLVGKGGSMSLRSVIRTLPTSKIVVGGNVVKVGREFILPMGEENLTSQGRYDLKTGRAVHTPRLGHSFSESHDTLGGALRDSIQAGDDSSGTLIGHAVFAGGKDAPYARYIEFGTRHNRAQPFLRPALAEHGDMLIDDIIAAFQSVAGMKVEKGR